MLQPGQGILTYITSNSWLKAEYGKPLRLYFAEKHNPLLLLELGKDVFESAIVDSGVLMLRSGVAPRPSLQWTWIGSSHGDSTARRTVGAGSPRRRKAVERHVADRARDL